MKNFYSKIFPLSMCLIVFTIGNLSSQISQTEETAKRILINSPSTEQLHDIQASGLDLHCGAKFEGDNLRLDLSYDEVLAIDQLGLNYDIIENDLTTFFVERAKNTRAQAESELALMKQRALEAKQNKSSLSTGTPTIDSYIQREDCEELEWVSQEFKLGEGFGGCLTVDEMIDELDRMRALYPDLISVRLDASPTGQKTYGDVLPNGASRAKQFDEQTIYYVRISDNPDTDEANEPESLITGMTHAREVNSMMNVIYYMWWLLENYDTDPAIQNMIDNQELYFIPIVNPDGVKWNEAIAPNGGGLQRKNLRPNVNDNGSTSSNSNRLRGVDLNRNSSYYWGFNNSGSSPSQSSDTYRGPYPASEPETQILADFVESKEFKYAINHHSGINSIVTSSYNGDPNAAPSNREDEYQKLMHDATRFNRYIHGSAPNTLTSANGDTNDYMLGGPPVTYNTIIDLDGDNFGNPGTSMSHTSSGSGKNIITFSPENGEDFWPPLTDITPIAQRAVRMNLLTSLYSGKYARLHDFTKTNITSTTASLDFAIEYLGQTSSDISLSIVPVSSNIISITQPGTLTDLDILEQQNTSATITLDTSIQANDAIEYEIILSNDSYIIYQTTFTKYYNPSVLLDADGVTGNWTTTGTWAETTDGFNGSTNAITSTPNPPYGNNVLSFATLNNGVNLSNTNSAVVHFNAKWDIERNFDLAQFEASIDGGTSWTALCGKYTKVPSGEQGNLHLTKNNSDESHQGNFGDLIYDGDLILDPNIVNTATANDDVDKWVQEEILLDPFNNDGIVGNANVLFRFRFDTDSTNLKDGYDTNFEGFTFDNFQVSAIDQAFVCASEVVDSFPYSLSFENGLVDWTQNTGDSDSGNWNENTGGTPTGASGPNQAQDGGTYYYAEASVSGTGSVGFDATLILTSPCIDLSLQDNVFFSFSYHMYGEDMGDLHTEITDDNGATWTRIIEATLSGEQQSTNDDDWKVQTVDLSAYANSDTNPIIQLRLVGITGNSFASDIAIDNLSIKSAPFCLKETTYTSTGWDNGFPDERTRVIIADDYNTAAAGLSSIDACELIINSNVTLTVSDDTYVKVENDITVNGTLNVSNAGSIVQVNNNALVIKDTNAIITVTKTTPDLTGREFVVLSSPMSAETNTGVHASADRVFGIITDNFVPNEDVAMEFPDAVNFADDNGDYIDNTVTDLGIGTGYLVFPLAAGNTNPVNYEHTYADGTLNNGVIDVAIEYTGATLTNFNVLGNPYPSAIDTDLLISSNPAINEVYLWDHITPASADLPGFNNFNFSMDDVSVRNIMMGVAAVNDMTGNIPGQYMVSGQGFGILADQAVAATVTPVTFTNALRVTENNGTIRSAEQEDNLMWLSLSSEAYPIQSKIGIGFVPEATAGYEVGYDSKQLATTISLYSTIESGEKLTIQGREAFDPEMEIQLGFSSLIPELENYTLSLDHLEGIELQNNDVFLIDNLLATTTNLKEESYNYSAAQSEQSNRFTLVFRDNAVLNTDDNTSIDNEIRIFPNPTKGAITLKSNNTQGLTQLVIRDILGKVIRTIDLQSFDQQETFDVSNLSSGVYFFQVMSETSSESIRVIKY